MNTTEILTESDVESYYGGKFVRIGPFGTGPFRNRGIKNMTALTFISRETRHTVSLAILETIFPQPFEPTTEEIEEARVRGEKWEDVPGIGNYAYWLGPHLTLAVDCTKMTVSATGLKQHSDETERRNAALAFAKHVILRIKEIEKSN